MVSVSINCLFTSFPRSFWFSYFLIIYKISLNDPDLNSLSILDVANTFLLLTSSEGPLVWGNIYFWCNTTHDFPFINIFWFYFKIMFHRDIKNTGIPFLLILLFCFSQYVFNPWSLFLWRRAIISFCFPYKEPIIST